MKNTFLVLALTGLLCMGLTSCGMSADKGSPGTETNNSSLNGSGQVGDLDQDEVGNADPSTNDNSNAQARRSATMRRTAYDYLNDGQYRAGSDGMVRDRNSIGKDLTQGARDLVRDAKELGRDMAKDVGDAARSAGQAAKDTGNAAKNTIRDKMT